MILGRVLEVVVSRKVLLYLYTSWMELARTWSTRNGDGKICLFWLEQVPRRRERVMRREFDEEDV